MAIISYGNLEKDSDKPDDGLTKPGVRLVANREWVASCPGDQPGSRECYASKRINEGYVVVRETLCANCRLRASAAS